MSIIAYVGLPGSGKSYDVVENQILPALKADRRVVTNIPLNRDEIRKDIRSGEIIELPLEVLSQQPERIEEYATPGCVFIVDEVWRLWPAGLKTDKVPMPFKSMLAEHRHRVDSRGNAMQIVLVTQDLAQIAAFARQLVEQTFHHTKLGHMGMRGTYRIDVFSGAITGAVPPVNNRLREVFGKYSPRVFKYYKSHTMSEAGKSGANEKPMDARGNMFKRPIVLIAAIAVPLLFGFGIWNIYSVFSPDGDSSLRTAGARERHPSPGDPASSGSGFRGPGLDRNRSAPRTWRVSGYVLWAGDGEAAGPGSFAILTNDERSVRVPFRDCFKRGFEGVHCLYKGEVIREQEAPVELRTVESAPVQVAASE